MRETQRNKVELPDKTYEEFDIFSPWIYSGNVQPTTNDNELLLTVHE